MSKTLKIVTISGGKDSTATAIWALEKYPKEQLRFVFCDVKWENKVTYQYIKYLESALNIDVIRLVSKKYFGFADMVLKLGRFPSSQRRFCTSELKVKPMIDYLLELQQDFIVIQGIRADESEERKSANMIDDYFYNYFTPYGFDKTGKPKYHTYRAKEVKEHCKIYKAGVYRPILNWKAQETFDLMKSKGIEPNPLYKRGSKRVGCYPCILCTQNEVNLIHEQEPKELIQLAAFEKYAKSTFFYPKFIPERFRTLLTSKGKKVASTGDVIKYISDDPMQTSLFKKPTINSCQSIYTICE